ncbi:hypothetical protein J3Q64DRAFT_1016379 [Phycomyces blakesleeanus]|uniref:Uncharacterized protein n=2 Tax=Phycomyces blakesleeanus TaxID=4837 RepID=A0A162NN46_PHYB8|nr:hypothetical protein PHYBLDRAFT_141462 [Phycomyces blakesleeanus NRRL 1555(-)]OAD77584.1 hypothetical protein PHYBLDRAFT_141462 [Phycomyces blakesleeanus NRRL 1555(-)]|eukprot:XP_018295624.1 hypothetical protein PHYBLDRAFT_141462 [Phycomyces blakesleeanus NRRL 1555(-)]
MPVAVLNSHQNHQKMKPIKWANQRVRTTTTKQPRVHKRTVSSASSWSNHTRTSTAGSSSSASSSSTFSSLGSLGSVDPNEAQTQKSQPVSEIDRLVTELAYAYDSVATITVHFDSLRHAYACSKSEIDRSTRATRLCDMEKELLTAYDDLGLQVVHLERKIVKLETRLTTLRLQERQKDPKLDQTQTQTQSQTQTQNHSNSNSNNHSNSHSQDHDMLIKQEQSPIGSAMIFYSPCPSQSLGIEVKGEYDTDENENENTKNNYNYNYGYDYEDKNLRNWASRPDQHHHQQQQQQQQQQQVAIGSPIFYEDSPYLLVNEQCGVVVPRVENGCMTPEYAYQHQDGMTFNDAPCYAISTQDSTLPYAPIYYENALASPISPTFPTFPMTVVYPTWSSSPRAGLT